MVGRREGAGPVPRTDPFVLARLSSQAPTSAYAMGNEVGLPGHKARYYGLYRYGLAIELHKYANQNLNIG